MKKEDSYEYKMTEFEVPAKEKEEVEGPEAEKAQLEMMREMLKRQKDNKPGMT